MSFREGTENLGHAIRMKALKVRECRISRGVGRECVFICRGKGNPVSKLRVQLWANLKKLSQHAIPHTVEYLHCLPYTILPSVTTGGGRREVRGSRIFTCT